MESAGASRAQLYPDSLYKTTSSLGVGDSAIHAFLHVFHLRSSWAAAPQKLCVPCAPPLRVCKSLRLSSTDGAKQQHAPVPPAGSGGAKCPRNLGSAALLCHGLGNRTIRGT